MDDRDYSPKILFLILDAFQKFDIKSFVEDDVSTFYLFGFCSIQYYLLKSRVCIFPIEVLYNNIDDL